MTRFVSLSLMSLCLWRLTLLTDMDAEWLQAQDKTSPLSFTRIRRATMRFVIRQIFRNSACEANFQKSGDVPKEMFRLIA